MFHCTSDESAYCVLEYIHFHAPMTSELVYRSDVPQQIAILLSEPVWTDVQLEILTRLAEIWPRVEEELAVDVWIPMPD